MRCEIIIPVWDQSAVTAECISSIVLNTACPYKFIIIDNGSEKRTRDYLIELSSRRFPEVTLIRNNENLGFVKAVNQGVKISSAPYLCIMNNDTIATAGWLEEMLKIMDSRPDIGMVNPSSNTSGQFPERGQSIDEYALTLKRLRGETQELYNCRGFCMLLRKTMVDEVGLFDEIYNMGYFEETDYSKRVHEKNYAIVRAKGAYVYHKEKVSFKELKNDDEIFKNNEKIFFRKWGRPVKIGYFVDRMASPDSINEIAVGAARIGHRVTLFLKKGMNWPVRIDHFDIRRRDLSPAFFGLASLYKIFKSKQRKKLEVIVTENKLFGAVLSTLKVLHGSDVLINPDKQELLDLLNAKSHVH